MGVLPHLAFAMKGCQVESLLGGGGESEPLSAARAGARCVRVWSSRCCYARVWVGGWRWVCRGGHGSAPVTHVMMILHGAGAQHGVVALVPLAPCARALAQASASETAAGVIAQGRLSGCRTVLVADPSAAMPLRPEALTGCLRVGDLLRAGGQTLGELQRPLTLVRRSDSALQALEAMAQQNTAVAVVVGRQGDPALGARFRGWLRGELRCSSCVEACGRCVASSRLAASDLREIGAHLGQFQK